jgi:hypothetical protein
MIVILEAIVAVDITFPIRVEITKDRAEFIEVKP